MRYQVTLNLILLDPPISRIHSIIDYYHFFKNDNVLVIIILLTNYIIAIYTK